MRGARHNDVKELAGLELSSEQILQLIHHCARDTDFPKTTAEWDRRIALAEEHARAEGGTPSSLALDLERFMGWCAHVGVVPGLDALRAHVILLRTPDAVDEYGSRHKGTPRARESA